MFDIPPWHVNEHQTIWQPSHRLQYTQGRSATLGSKNGDLAVVITQVPANNPTTQQLSTPLRNEGESSPTYSFDEESAALSTVLLWIKDYNPTISKTVFICSDKLYLFLCEALLGRNACVNNIQMLLNAIQAHIIQWIPWHLNVPGNDLAGRAVKQAADLPPSADLPVAFWSALIM